MSGDKARNSKTRSTVGASMPARGLTKRKPQGVTQILERLPEMERKVMDLRYGITGGHPQSPTVAGNTLGLTARETQEIERRAIERLRAIVPDKDLARLLAVLVQRRQSD